MMTVDIQKTVSAFSIVYGVEYALYVNYSIYMLYFYRTKRMGSGMSRSNLFSVILELLIHFIVIILVYSSDDNRNQVSLSFSQILIFPFFFYSK